MSRLRSFSPHDLSRSGSSLLLCYVSAKSFTFKSSEKEESKWTKFKGKALPKVMKAAKYFTAPPPIDVNASDPDQLGLRVPEEVEFDPCSTSDQLCMNGGECRNDRGKFYCNCHEKYYGKRCELVANKAACVTHSCKNGGVCYTTPDTQKIVDRAKLTGLDQAITTYSNCRNDNTKSADECERLKLTQTPPTKEDFDDIAKTVYYRCQCPLGFQGPLCDYSRDERLCDEDFCMGHGYAILKEGKCSCACEPEYTGEHCESLLPCSAFPCHNEGICKDQYDESAGTYTASCVCPDMMKEITKGQMEITGEHCEILTLKDELERLDPCGDINKFIEAIEIGFGEKHKQRYLSLTAGTGTESSLGQDVLMQICGTSSQCRQQVSVCSGIKEACGLVAGPVSVGSNKVLFPLPRCACPNLHEGKFCQNKLESLCYPTQVEQGKGISFESRCTSLDNGKCNVNVNNERYCECTDNFVGDRCEIFAPCATKPCGENADCIPIPSEQSRPGEQSYRCICDVGDEQNGNECIYKGVGTCAGDKNPCNHGKCVSCPDTSGSESSICNEEEQKKGRRCICAPGFAPPNCKEPLGPCEAHLCQNGGICKINKEHTYDCSCPPGTIGDYCETIDDYCEFAGERACSNTGTCSNTNQSIRGFLCSCEWEYRGADCEVFVGKWAGFYQMFDENYMFTYPIVALFFCVIFLVLADFMCGQDRKEKRKKGMAKTSVSSANEPSKNSKISHSSAKVEGAIDSVPSVPENAKVDAATPVTPVAVEPLVVATATPPVATAVDATKPR